MVYNVGNPPQVGGGYGMPDPDDMMIINWVFAELTKLADVQAETIALDLRPTAKEPERPQEGMIVFASAGAGEWLPYAGATKGLHVFIGGVWHRITTTAPPPPP